MSGYRLRYKPDTNDGKRFKTIRYPTLWNPPYATRERAELVRAAMPDPSKFEVVEDGE